MGSRLIAIEIISSQLSHLILNTDDDDNDDDYNIVYLY